MNLEEEIKLHKELSEKIEALEQQKKALALSIMQQMQGPCLKLAGYLVRRISRLSIKLSLEEARQYDAVKLEEIVDNNKIKALYHNGQSLKGVSEIHYIQVLKTPSL